MYYNQELHVNKILYDTKGGPEFKTTISVTTGGFEGRKSAWNEYRYKAELGERNIDQKEASYLRDFFNHHQGKLHTFKIKDWADYKVTRDQSYLQPTTNTVTLYSGVYSNYYKLMKKVFIGGDIVLKPITCFDGTDFIKTYIRGVDTRDVNYGYDDIYDYQGHIRLEWVSGQPDIVFFNNKQSQSQWEIQEINTEYTIIKHNYSWSGYKKHIYRSGDTVNVSTTWAGVVSQASFMVEKIDDYTIKIIGNLKQYQVYQDAVPSWTVVINFDLSYFIEEIEWEATFKKMVRFDTDELSIEFLGGIPVGKNSLGHTKLGDRVYHLKSLPIVEVVV